VVRAGGIGLQVRVPSGVLAQLDGVGRPVELFTHLHVRENELALYGFLTEEELTLFKLLLSISGVGPKVALALLGTVSPDALRQAVVQEEPGLLSRVPGIGPKTARAIIFHLKDKLVPAGADAVRLLSDTDAEVIAALTGLGFSLVEAQAALQSLARDEDLSVEERVRQALAYFAAP
jgi:Holliday junction DNA helicase RuvA